LSFFRLLIATVGLLCKGRRLMLQCEGGWKWIG
jgi:hypothetical protein